MEIFGIGPLEFLLIILIMLLLLGPKEMLQTARKIGQFVRQLVKSPIWGEVMETSREIRDLPNKLVEDTGLGDDIAQIKKDTSAALKDVNVDIGKADLDKTQPAFQPPVPFQAPIPGKNGNGSQVEGQIVIEPAATNLTEPPVPPSSPVTNISPLSADDGASRIVIE
jgi:Sec-independent protein translocase protein TatA